MHDNGAYVKSAVLSWALDDIEAATAIDSKIVVARAIIVQAIRGAPADLALAAQFLDSAGHIAKSRKIKTEALLAELAG